MAKHMKTEFLTIKKLRTKILAANGKDKEDLVAKVLRKEIKLYTTSYNYNYILREYEKRNGTPITQDQDSSLKQIVQVIFFPLPLLQGILLSFFITLLVVLPAEKYLILNPFLWNYNNNCAQILTGDKSQAYSILQSCEAVIGSRFTWNDSALNAARKSAGRAALVYWDELSDEQEKEGRQDAVVQEVKNHFVVAGKYKPRDPQAKFYSALMDDFYDFVLTPEELDCQPASQRYSEAIDLYAGMKNVDTVENDFFALLELGHFLVSRDRAQASSNLSNNFLNDLNGYEKAIELYGKLTRIADDNARYTTLLSLAKAQLLDEQYEEARDSFVQALDIDSEAYQINYYIGNSLALENGNYGDAVKHYDEVTENLGTDEYYHALRDSGFAYYMISDYTQAKDRFERAVALGASHEQTERSKKNLMEEYLGKIDRGRCDQLDSKSSNCSREDRKVLREELLKQGVFQSIFTVHDKKKGTDPFLDVEHDAFYKCRADAEFS